MRGMRVCVLLTTSTLALFAVSPAAARASADLFAVGGGHILDNKFGTFDLSAHTGPQGDFGHVGLKVPAAIDNLYVDVDCVSVYGLPNVVGAAWVTGTVKRVSTPNLLNVDVGDRQAFYVLDAGKPSAVPVDAFYFVQGAAPLDCRQMPQSVFPPNVSEGNVNIKLG